MLYRNASIFAFACMLGVTGCRDNGTLTPADLSMAGGGGGGGGGGTGTGDMAATNYVPSSIAMMRQGAPGTYELDDVIAIALTPSTKSPKLVVQDAAGGDYSAIQLLCPASGTHMCTMQSTIHTTTIGHKVTVKGLFVKDSKMSGGGLQFYVSTITDNGAGTAPAPLMRDQTAIEQATDAGVTGFDKDFWQMVTVTPTENLVMYDWTPTALKYSGSGAWPGCSTAPYVFGFAMAPASANLTATAACTVKTAPAPSQATPDGRQIYIGTDYYTSFQVSSDCQCAKTPTTVPAAGTQWPSGMAMTGILGYETPVPGTATTGYKIFSPIPATAGPGVLTGTVAPPM